VCDLGAAPQLLSQGSDVKVFNRDCEPQHRVKDRLMLLGEISARDREALKELRIEEQRAQNDPLAVESLLG
jgi:hypothetical protein